MKKRTCLILSLLMLVIGLLGGILLAPAAREKLHIPAALSASADSSAQPVDTDNTSLLTASAHVLTALKSSDWKALSACVGADGVTFTPHSTVDSTNLHFSAGDLAKAGGSSTPYIWGVSPETNKPIQLSIPDYFRLYVWDEDYSAIREIGVDSVVRTGNAVENVASSYPDCRFLDFYSPGSPDRAEDWSALKLVFRWENNRWALTAIIHSGWTP